MRRAGGREREPEGSPRRRGSGRGGTAGAICSSSGSTGTDLVPTHNAIKAHVSSAPAVVMDETGWRIGGEGAWLWAAATDDATWLAVGEPLRRVVQRSGSRDELLNVEEFGSLVEAQVIVEACRIEYNSYRPHSALGGLTDDEVYAKWTTPIQPALS